jgi:hypothetical protein
MDWVLRECFTVYADNVIEGNGVALSGHDFLDEWCAAT